MAASGDEAPADRLLSSWKEIATFFGKDERTVKRWEATRGLPVRRVPRGSRSSVFAYRNELEAWLLGPVPATATQGQDSPTPPPVASRSPVRIGLVVAAVLILAGLAASGLIYRTSSTHTPTPAALALYQQGVIDWSSRTAAGFDRAIAEFAQVTTMEPGYAPAYAGLANTYNLVSQYTDAPAAESYAKAKAAAEKAVALDPQLAEGYAALAFNAFYGSHDLGRSVSLFEHAVALDPNSAQTLHWSALVGMHTGSFERPLELIDRALLLSPDSRTIRANKALILFHAGHADEAIALLKALQQAQPDYLATPSYLATIYLAVGRYAEFLDAYEEAARVGANSARLAIAAEARKGFAATGRDGLFEAMYGAQQAQYQAKAEPAYTLAVTAAMRGDRAAALELLEASFAVGEADIIGLRIEEAFHPLYGEPRFRALLTKVGLPLPA